MELFWELIIYCIVFTLLVRLAVKKGPLEGLFFYPEAVQERAFSIGLTNREELRKKKKRFMIPFVLIMFLLLLFFLVINKADDFLSAYLQSLLFLEVMNWYDGIVIDRIWVGHSSFWIIPELEEIPYIQTWRQVFRKRVLYTFVYAVLSLFTAGIGVLLCG